MGFGKNDAKRAATKYRPWLESCTISLGVLKKMHRRATAEEANMERLNLDYEEFQQVAHLCHWLPPGFDLKPFLLNHLRHRLPGTASKIESLGERELNALSEQIDAQRRAPRFEPSHN